MLYRKVRREGSHVGGKGSRKSQATDAQASTLRRSLEKGKETTVCLVAALGGFSGEGSAQTRVVERLTG